jgi:hypothetical protein
MNGRIRIQQAKVLVSEVASLLDDGAYAVVPWRLLKAAVYVYTALQEDRKNHVPVLGVDFPTNEGYRIVIKKEG